MFFLKRRLARIETFHETSLHARYALRRLALGRPHRVAPTARLLAYARCAYGSQYTLLRFIHNAPVITTVNTVLLSEPTRKCIFSLGQLHDHKWIPNASTMTGV